MSEVYNSSKPKGVEDVSVDEINIKRLFQLLFNQKWMLLICMVVAITAVVFYFILSKKTYESTFTIYYNEDLSPIGVSENLTQYQTEFDSKYWKHIMESKRHLFMIRSISGLDIPIDYLENTFFISQDKKDKKIFQVEINVFDPHTVVPLTNSFVQSLNTLEHLNLITANKKLKHNLSEQLQQKIKQLSQLEREIMQCNSQININDIDGYERLKQNYADYKKSLKDCQIEMTVVIATKRKIQEEFSNHNDTLMQEISFTEPLKVQLMNLQVDLARSLTKCKESHPLVKGIRKNIYQIETLLNNGINQNVEIKNLAANPLKRKLMVDLVEVETQERALTARIDALKKAVEHIAHQLQLSLQDNGLSVILQKKELLISSIKHLNSSVIDVEAVLSGESAHFVLIDQPVEPITASRKPLLLLVLVAGMVGVMLGVVLILGLDFIDNRIRFISDYEDLYSTPILGTLQHRNKNFTIKEAVIFKKEDIDELLHREMAEIRININQLVTTGTNCLISTVSASRKEGKTLMSYLLAQELARTDDKVLLVDMDTYSPKLTWALQLRKEKGVQDYLFARTPLGELIHTNSHAGIDTIGVGQNSMNTPIYYDTIRLKTFIEEVSQKYQWVIFDTPALLYIPEIRNFLKMMQGIVLVAKLNSTTRSNMDKVVKKTQNIPAQTIGVILTDAEHNPFDGYNENRYYYEYKQRERV